MFQVFSQVLVNGHYLNLCQSPEVSLPIPRFHNREEVSATAVQDWVYTRDVPWFYPEPSTLFRKCQYWVLIPIWTSVYTDSNWKVDSMHCYAEMVYQAFKISSLQYFWLCIAWVNFWVFVFFMCCIKCVVLNAALLLPPSWNGRVADVTCCCWTAFTFKIFPHNRHFIHRSARVMLHASAFCHKLCAIVKNQNKKKPKTKQRLGSTFKTANPNQWKSAISAPILQIRSGHP